MNKISYILRFVAFRYITQTIFITSFLNALSDAPDNYKSFENSVKLFNHSLMKITFEIRISCIGTKLLLSQ